MEETRATFIEGSDDHFGGGGMSICRGGESFGIRHTLDKHGSQPGYGNYFFVRRRRSLDDVYDPAGQSDRC